MKKYVDILEKSGIQIFKELNECIETIKEIKNLEICNIWSCNEESSK